MLSDEPHAAVPYQQSRRAAREAVLKALFQMEFQQIDATAALQYALQTEESEPDTTDDAAVAALQTANPRLNEVDHIFAQQLLSGVLAKCAEIDEILSSFARDWSLSRIGKLERSILRMALYELLWRAEIPAAATLDESVELTKTFCAVEAAAFINGILGNIHKHLLELHHYA